MKAVSSGMSKFVFQVSMCHMFSKSGTAINQKGYSGSYVRKYGYLDLFITTITANPYWPMTRLYAKDLAHYMLYNL